MLLTLLHLNVKNIRVGPKPPAFLTPEALAVLVDKYQLKVRMGMRVCLRVWGGGYG